ncbi:MAG: OmpA family protein [Flavobacteriaceae bacterium]
MFSFFTKNTFSKGGAFTLFFIFFFIHTNTLQAQTEEIPWQFFVGINAIDTYPTGASGSGAFLEEYANLNHWNITPHPSVIGVKKYMGAGFSFGTRFSFNSIKKYGALSASDTYYNIDGIVSYNLNSLFGGQTVKPFLELGGGYALFDQQGAGYFNLGAGLEFWLGKNKKTALILETIYKNTGETYGVKHFQHLAGIAFLFGEEKDTDGDGIPNKEDLCPEQVGIALFQGCPDTDQDGIQDAEDNCPFIAGISRFNGCPDTDKDGVQDAEDDCPNTFGLPEFSGCPDTDGDGIRDVEDACPEEPGTQENEGCPEISEEDFDRLQEIGQIIYFATDRYDLNTENHIILDEVHTILERYSSFNILVEGHTDSVGRVSYNQELSERRAATVRDYLIQKGIPSSQISSKGYGETRPIEENTTKEGREKNRRVVFKVQR